MTCQVTESINKALRACGACMATGAQRDIVLVDRMEASRAFPANQVDVRLGAPVRDAQGRIAHVRGFWLVGNVRITSQAVSDAVSAYNLRRLFRQMVMQDVTGWQFFANIDMRSLLDDVWSRHFARISGGLGRLAWGVEGAFPVITTDNGVPVNAGVTADYDITSYYPLVTLGAGASPIEGLIPLAALQLASQPFRFTFGQTSDLPGAPVGQAVDSYRRRDGSVGLDVYLDLVYLPAVVADLAWHVDHYTQQELTLDLPNGDRKTEHLSLRYLPEDAAALAGFALAAQCDGLALSVAGNATLKGVTAADAFTRTMLFCGSSRSSALVADAAAQDLPLLAASGAPAIQILYPSMPRDAAPAGTISFGATTRTPTFWRFLHRTVRCPGSAQVAQRAAAMYAAAKCGPCGAIFGSTAKGEANGAPQNTRPLIMQPRAFMK